MVCNTSVKFSFKLATYREFIKTNKRQKKRAQRRMLSETALDNFARVLVIEMFSKWTDL